jgi:RinA family phage transcriptional activator
MIDVKKLLYRYKQFVEAKRNAEASLHYLQNEYVRHRTDENWYIRGVGVPSNITESTVLIQEDTARRIGIIKEVIGQLADVIETVERASNTLNDECRTLVQLRYFDDKKPEAVRMKMGLTETPYFHIQRIALENMSKCFSTKLWTDEYLDQLLFIPLMDRFKNTMERKDLLAQLRREEKKISSF